MMTYICLVLRIMIYKKTNYICLCVSLTNYFSAQG